MAKSNPIKGTKKDAQQHVSTQPSAPFFKRLTLAEARLLAPEGVLVLLSIIAFSWITYCYPFPATMNDMGGYVHQAQINQPSVYRPFGYSWFLMKVHGISTTYRFVTIVQLLLHLASTLLFLRAVFNFFPSQSRVFTWVLVILLALSPLPIYMTNMLLSDSLFTSLTLFWLASGMFLIRRFDWPLFLFHLLAMFLAMKVRYIGLIYPIVTVFILLLGNAPVWRRAALATLPLIIGAFFYTSTRQANHKMYSVNTFSGFSGWQMANNALHIFPYADIKSEEIQDTVVRNLYDYVKLFGDTIYPAPGVTTTDFMWDNNKPLKHYFLTKIAEEKQMMAYGRRWLYAGTKFERFGNYFIRKYPLLFARHFFLPNLKDVVDPPLGVVHAYTETKIGDMDGQWFGLEKDKVIPARFLFYEKYVNPWLSIFHAVVTCLGLALLLAAAVFRRRLRLNPLQWRILAMWVLFEGAFAAFSAFASIVEIRYLGPLVAVQTALPVVLLAGFMKREAGA